MPTDTSFTDRAKWIDILKGIAIFFVVLGHSPYLSHLPSKVFNVIFSFHMPLFFFIAGYLFYPGQPLSELLRKRLNSLLKPFAFTVIVISLPYMLFKSEPKPLWYFFWMLYGNGPNLPKLSLHLWFLPHLFLVTLLIWSLFRICKFADRHYFFIIASAIFFLAFGVMTINLFWNIKIPNSELNFFINNVGLFLSNGVLQNPAYINDAIIPNQQFILRGLPWSLDIVFVSSSFFIAGYILKHRFNEGIFGKHYILLVATILFFLLHLMFNVTIDLNLRRYDSLLNCSMLAFAGIYIFSYLSFQLSKQSNSITNGIAYIGQKSLIVYIFHLIIQSKVYLLLILVPFQHNAIIAFVLALIAGIGGPLLLNHFLLERLNFLRFWYYK